MELFVVAYFMALCQHLTQWTM